MWFAAEKVATYSLAVRKISSRREGRLLARGASES